MLSPDRSNSGGADSKYFKLKLKVPDYFNVKFYFSNASLNSVQRINYFPQQRIKIPHVCLQVPKRFGM